MKLEYNQNPEVVYLSTEALLKGQQEFETTMKYFCVMPVHMTFEITKDACAHGL